MIERHPFAPFVPPDCDTLILGSFPGRRSTDPAMRPVEDDWYYGAPRNQFWTLMSRVYDRELRTTRQKKDLLSQYRIGLGDLILSCERRDGKNTDRNLVRRIYNREALLDIFTSQPIRRVLCTGAGVRRDFLRLFKASLPADPIVLPSPSPLFCRLSLKEKAERYRRILLSR